MSKRAYEPRSVYEHFKKPGKSKVSPVPSPICAGCNKRPGQIEEYVAAAQEEETTPDTFVQRNEGTYNRSNGHFLCTECYIKAGEPSSPRGWVCP